MVVMGTRTRKTVLLRGLHRGTFCRLFADTMIMMRATTQTSVKQHAEKGQEFYRTMNHGDSHQED